MIDYKKLCEDLRKYDYWLGSTGKYAHDIHPKICDDAADAIEELQAENEQQRQQISDLTDSVALAADATKTIEARYKVENERLKKQLDAAVLCINECDEAFSNRCHDDYAEAAIEAYYKSGEEKKE